MAHPLHKRQCAFLCDAIMFGFSGGGGTPLLKGTETKKPTDIEWLSPQSEYRPTEHIQQWLSFWFDEQKRLKIAKFFQEKRLAYLEKVWHKDKTFKSYDFALDDMSLGAGIEAVSNRICYPARCE